MDAFESVREIEEAEVTSLAEEQDAAANSSLNEVRKRLAGFSQAMAKCRLKSVQHLPFLLKVATIILVVN